MMNQYARREADNRVRNAALKKMKSSLSSNKKMMNTLDRGDGHRPSILKKKKRSKDKQPRATTSRSISISASMSRPNSRRSRKSRKNILKISAKKHDKSGQVSYRSVISDRSRTSKMSKRAKRDRTVSKHSKSKSRSRIRNHDNSRALSNKNLTRDRSKS